MSILIRETGGAANRAVVHSSLAPLLSSDSNQPGSRDREAASLAWIQAGWFLCIALAWCVALLTRALDPDYTAGELLDHLFAWRETGTLYPVLGAVPSPSLRVFNYPPLVLAMVRAATALGVPALLAGRLVNAAGALCLVSAVASWTRARGARGPVLAGTVGLLGASFPVLYALGQFHIELWAVAGTVWAFCLLDRAGSRRGAAAAGLVLAVACFAKQTQVVPALVALAWAWRVRRSVARFATVAFVAGALGGVVVISVAFGAEAWRHMLAYTVGVFSLQNLGAQALEHAAPWAALLAFAACVAVREPSARRDPVVWYWLGALVWSISAARIGSSYQYFLDLHVATVVLIGPRIFDGSLARIGAPRWVMAALVVQIVGADLGSAVALSVNMTRLARLDRALPALCTRAAGSEMLTEEAGVARACGRPARIHPFIMTSLAARGRWDPAPFERALRAGEYGPIVLPFDPRAPVTGVHAERWTPGQLAAFRGAPSIEPGPAERWIVRWR